MKRILLCAALLWGACATALAGGIESAKDLQAFIEACNQGGDILPWCTSDTTVVLTADIDLGKVKKLPQVQSFSGHFDGQGHRILNWKADGGLFREIAKGAIVENLIIDGSCSMKVTTKAEECCLGFIADINRGTIRDCENHGNITHKTSYTSNSVWVGGIAGANNYVILRCRNTGKIRSDVNAETKESASLQVGGITGGSRGKAQGGSVVGRCVNEGAVSVTSNMGNEFIGGIVGKSGSQTVKYCVNHGAVKSESRLPDVGEAVTVSQVGGIAGQAKGDLLRCDNNGPVTAAGAGSGAVAGIVAMPHESLVIADCVNRGTVTAMSDQPSHAGGIAARIGRPVHVRGCTNYGKVSFEGLSPRARSTAGGIVGTIYTPKTAEAAAYVRNCVNHGTVNASAGGNKYDASSNKSIHAGGIVGFAGVREDLRCLVVDCSNDGRIVCSSGRKGNICAGTSHVTVGGAAPQDGAGVVAVRPDGTNVSGKVCTPDGQPLEGVVVTDGLQCVKTGADGAYAMHSDLSQVRFIYLSLPADVQIPTFRGVPQFFRRVPRGAEAVQADFVLEKREIPARYSVMMIADPQVRPFGMDGSMEAWTNSVAPDAEAFRAASPVDVYSINLGDLVYNYMDAWDDYMDAAARIACPTFNVIGNHDYDQANLFETAMGNVYFETYVGPEHYSFDLGAVHYVVMNTILYDRKTTAERYHYGLDEETVTWLENDLAFVPHDRKIVACTHAQLFKNKGTSPNGSHGAYNLNYKRYLNLLRPYKAVYAWSGHYHSNFYYNYAGKQTRHGAPNIQCITVGRCTGALRHNGEIDSYGAPRGYIVMDVNGDDIEWYYKSVGHDASYQMRSYSPERTGDGSVLVNVWNWSEGWSVPAWYEAGVKVADMESCPGPDPDYQILFDQIKSKTTRRYCEPKEAHLFRIVPGEGVRSGEIRVTDLFGHTYTQTVTW